MSNVNSPKHYQITDNLEAIDIIDILCKKNGNFFKHTEFSYYAQMLQYLFRCGNKNELEDLKKAEYFLKRLIKTVEQRQTVE